MNYLKDEDVLRWLRQNPFRHITSQKIRKEAEDSWGKKVSGKKSVQWTTELSQDILKEYLTYKGFDVYKKKYKSKDGKTLDPDFETEDCIYECKCRTWNTSGTAGEKILGTPFKYCELPEISGKRLNIVLMGYQEEEANKFGIFGSKSKEKNEMVEYWKTKNIYFVKFTTLLEDMKQLNADCTKIDPDINVKPKDDEYVKPKDDINVKPKDNINVKPKDDEYVKPKDDINLKSKDDEYVKPKDDEYVKPKDNINLKPKDNEHVEKKKVLDKKKVSEEKKKEPKNPRSSYIYFCIEKRNEIKERNPQMSSVEITRELGRVWREEYIDEKSRKKWTLIASEDKKRYKEEKKRKIS